MTFLRKILKLCNSDSILYLECYLAIQDCVTNLALFRRMLMLELRILVFELEGTREELKSIDDECLEKHSVGGLIERPAWALVHFGMTIKVRKEKVNWPLVPTRRNPERRFCIRHGGELVPSAYGFHKRNGRHVRSGIWVSVSLCTPRTPPSFCPNQFVAPPQALFWSLHSRGEPQSNAQRRKCWWQLGSWKISFSFYLL